MSAESVGTALFICPVGDCLLSSLSVLLTSRFVSLIDLSQGLAFHCIDFFLFSVFNVTDF
jgi:hypothetical protein